ncbi:MAG: hypothetical protein R3246_10555 [Acidimicrobiia bacterium]|nr:hypothetical protein [Acidimicrobiia bacterium]
MSKEHGSRAARWGWGIILATASLMAVNGVGWIFFGPDAVVSDTAGNIGISVAEFGERYPGLVDEITVNQYQVAIYLMALGATGFMAASAGYRMRYRWAWRITWVLVAIPVALVVSGLAAGFGVGGFLAVMLPLALIALVGQLLAGSDLVEQGGGSVSSRTTTS